MKTNQKQKPYTVHVVESDKAYWTKIGAVDRLRVSALERGPRQVHPLKCNFKVFSD